MSQSDRSQSDDLYRETIEDSDLTEKSLFLQENNIKKEENSLNFVKKKEQIEDEKPISKEDFPQQPEIAEEKPLQNNPSIKESLTDSIRKEENVEIEEKKLEEIKPAEQIGEDSSREKDAAPKEEPAIIVKKEVLNKQEEKPVIEIKEKPSFKENQAPAAESLAAETKKEEYIEPAKEENIKKEISQIKKSYKELRDELWNKVNPANSERFELLNIEEIDQNKAFLNDIAVKITFLNDDFEDKLISEDEAIKKIKELENKIQALTN